MLYLTQEAWETILEALHEKDHGANLHMEIKINSDGFLRMQAENYGFHPSEVRAKSVTMKNHGDKSTILAFEPDDFYWPQGYVGILGQTLSCLLRILPHRYDYHTGWAEVHDGGHEFLLYIPPGIYRACVARLKKIKITPVNYVLDDGGMQTLWGIA